MDKIDEIRKEIEECQEKTKKEMLLDPILEKFEEEKKEYNLPDWKVILTLAIISTGLILGLLSGVLGFIQILKWIISVIKAMF